MDDTLGARGRDPPRPLLFLLSAALIASAVILFVWAQRQDRSDRVIGRPASFGAGGPILELWELTEEPIASNLLGRTVSLGSVDVQAVVGDYLFWVGPSAERRMPVVLLGELTSRQPETAKQIREGQRVRVLGIVRLLRDVETIARTEWLSPQEQAALQERLIFISAERVEIVQPAER